MELRAYQHEALVHMAVTRRVIYADAPGTGKTATSLRWLDAMTTGGPGLIVAPKPVLWHWIDQAETWAPDRRLLPGWGTPKARRSAREDVRQSPFGHPPAHPSPVLVVNYETLRNDIEELHSIRWSTVIFDEAHRLKNRRSLVHSAAMKVGRRAQCLAMVTGTPILNNAQEAWSLLHIISPDDYRSFWKWAAERFQVEQRHFYSHMGRPVTMVGDPLPGALDRIREEVGATLIQRPLEELLPDLPDVTEIALKVDLTPAERAAYRSMVKRCWVEVEGTVIQAVNEVAKISRLRQLSSDWSVFGGGGGSKVAAVKELILDLSPEQVVVLVAYKATAARLAADLAAADVDVALYTGDHDEAHRTLVRQRFRSGGFRVIVGTHATLGEGVDGLQVARHIVLLDRDWTPARNDQAIARIRRSGQKADAVCVYTVTARGTIDETVERALRSKTAVVDWILGRNIKRLLEGKL